MSFADVEKGISDLGARAREGNITLEDLSGGTFTVSNGGVYGSLMGTPIINPPQSAILGLHAIKPRPVAVNGSIEIRPMMYLALTYDHRLIDGREAVTFLCNIRDNVECVASLRTRWGTWRFFGTSLGMHHHSNIPHSPSQGPAQNAPAALSPAMRDALSSRSAAEAHLPGQQLRAQRAAHARVL